MLLLLLALLELLPRVDVVRSDCMELSRARPDRNENWEGSLFRLLLLLLGNRVEVPKMNGS